MHASRCALVFAFVTALPITAVAAPQAELRVVTVTGERAPGTAAGVTFSGLNAPRIDAAGNITFGAFLAGPNLTTGHMGVFAESGGVLELVAQRGDPAPGAGPGATFTTTGFVPLSPSISGGLVAFRSPILPLGGGIFEETPSGLAAVVIAGQQAPGLASGVTMGVGEPTLGAPGSVVFGSFLSGTGVNASNDESIWSDRSSRLALVVREGMRAPGTSLVFGAGSSQFAPGALRVFAVGPDSRIFLHGNVSGRGVDDLNDEGLWLEGPSGLTLIAREGAQAPGFPSGVRFSNGVANTFGDSTFITVSDAGAAFFQAGVAGANVNATAADTLWTTRSGTPQALVRGRILGATPKGDAAPGFPGRSFTGFTNLLRPNAANRLAFVGVIEGAPGTADFDFGIWSDRSGPIALVVGDGHAVPDQPGVFFGVGSNRNSYELLRLANDGRVFFTTAVRGAVPVGTAGLFVSSPNGAIRTLLQTGDPVDVAGDGSDVRTLRTFFVGGTNAAGAIAISLFFTNNTQAIVTIDP